MLEEEEEKGTRMSRRGVRRRGGGKGIGDEWELVVGEGKRLKSRRKRMGQWFEG